MDFGVCGAGGDPERSVGSVDFPQEPFQRRRSLHYPGILRRGRKSTAEAAVEGLDFTHETVLLTAGGTCECKYVRS
jgi:hypothetical protein